MIKQIKVNKLFGRFNYTFSFTNEGIMIITGPNGYGKSTVLRMIDYFCNNNIKKLLNVSFKKFTIKCENTSVIIEKNIKSFKINGFSFEYLGDIPSRDHRLFFDLTGEKERSSSARFSRNRRLFFGYPDREEIEALLRPILRPQYYEDSEKVLDIFLNDSYFRQLIFMYLRTEQEDNLKKKIKELYEEVLTLSEVRKEIGTVSFIQEQRLLEKKTRTKNSEGEEYIKVINENSEKLKKELSSVMQRHSSISSELDSTYIMRLFQADVNAPKDVKEISDQLSILKTKQEKLQKYGLSEPNDASDFLLNDQQKINRFNVELSVYLADANTKYGVFESIIDKLELYETIVNNKLSFKKMRLSSTCGIEVISDDDEVLRLSDLSSGEQEILVLFYKLIFESDVNVLLIDEPEISLHIVWQKELLSDLKRIVQFNKNIQIIIATHSPQIISNNWELQIDLGSQYNG